MHDSEVFIMGTGFSSGEGRAMDAVNQALESPLLDSNDIFGTKNILLNIVSGKEEIRIGEIGEIIETLQEKAGQEADIIWGNGYDESLGDNVSVTILATGFVQNPNQTLQPKVEQEKFELEKEPEKEMENELEEDDFERSFLNENEEETNAYQPLEEVAEVFTIKEKAVKKKPFLQGGKRETKNEKKKLMNQWRSRM